MNMRNLKALYKRLRLDLYGWAFIPLIVVLVLKLIDWVYWVFIA